MTDTSNTVIVEFKARDTGIAKTFDQIAEGAKKATDASKEAANSILNDYLGLGIALTGAGLLEYFNHTAEKIDNMVKAATGLGVTTQSLQAFNYAVSLSGVEASEAADGLKHFGTIVGQALGGNEEAIASFKALGLSMDDLKGKDITQQYIQTATAAGQLENKNLAASTAATIFGRNYTTALNLGRDGIRENIKEFDALGVTLTNTQTKAVKSFGDAKSKLGAIFDGFVQKVTADVSPAFDQLVSGVTDWVQANGGIDGVAVKVGNKITEIVETSIEVFNELKPGFNALFSTLGSIMDKAAEYYKKAKRTAQDISDNISNGNTNSHARDPGLGDFIVDSSGYGQNITGINTKNLSLNDIVQSSLNPKAIGYYPTNAFGATYNPNNDGANGLPKSKIPSIYMQDPGFGPASTTNPYATSTANLANVAGDAFSSLNKVVKTSSETLENWTAGVQKSNDKITAGLKGMEDKETNDRLSKVFGIVSANNNSILGEGKDDPTNNFDNQAADLIQTLKDAGAGGVDPALFNQMVQNLQKASISDLAGGFKTTGQEGVIEEINKYAASLGQKDKARAEVSITISPTPDFSVKVLTNKDAAPYLAAAVAQTVAQAASTGALT